MVLLLEVIILIILILKFFLIIIMLLFFYFTRNIRILNSFLQLRYSTLCFAFVVFCSVLFFYWLRKTFVFMIVKIFVFVIIAFFNLVFAKVLCWFFLFHFRLLFRRRLSLFLRNLINNLLFEIIIIHDRFASKWLVSIWIEFRLWWLIDFFWGGRVTIVNCG